MTVQDPRGHPKEVNPSCKETEKPFIVSEALPVVPIKLVKRIQKGEFVDMAELLKDNMEMERRRSLVERGAMSAFQPRLSRREIPNVLSWIHCFSLYAAVLCTKYPEKFRELLAYQALIVGEAQRGGRGWIMYDIAFRQQITSIEETDFAKINQSLYSTTCMAYGAQYRVCHQCNLADHSPEECAMHPGNTLPILSLRDAPPRRPQEERGRAWEPVRKRRRQGVCYAHNSPGGCSRPACEYDHRCSQCKGEHTRMACTKGDKK